MPTIRYVVAIAAALMAYAIADAAVPVQLSEKEFKSRGTTAGIVILQINWGRKWRCGDFQNAQLEKLQFSLSPVDPTAGLQTTLDLETPSKLFVNDSFTPYALLVSPGKYVLTGFDMKVARSASDVGHFRPAAAQLIENGQPVGGEFTVAPAEIVYIGDIGLDCTHQPIPWRYYIERRSEFDAYVSGFRKQFPFVGDTPVAYRLMTTKVFGHDYVLEEAPSASK